MMKVALGEGLGWSVSEVGRSYSIDLSGPA